MSKVPSVNPYSHLKRKAIINGVATGLIGVFSSIISFQIQNYYDRRVVQGAIDTAEREGMQVCERLHGPDADIFSPQALKVCKETTRRNMANLRVRLKGAL